MTKPHYGLAYPPKPPRWRRRLVLVGLLLAALYWEYGRYTFEIVEIDDGSAPGTGPVIMERYVDGERIFVKSVVPSAANRGGVILVEPHRSFGRSITYSTNRHGAGALALTGELGLAKRRCIAIVRWHAGQASYEGCSRFANFDST